MDQICSSKLPHHQPEHPHEFPTQTTTFPSTPPQLFSQSNSMECNPSAISSSPPPLYYPIEFIHSTSSPSLFQGTIATPSTQARKELAARRTERRRVKRNLRLEARSTPLQLVACRHQHLSQGEMKVIESLLLKEFQTKRELKRAKKTGRTDTFPAEFQTINLRNDHNNERINECEQLVITEDNNIGTESKATKAATFAGLITIQDRLKATQTLSPKGHGCVYNKL